MKGTNALQSILKNNFFFIPDYQRGYSWQETQVQELCRDIDTVDIGEIHYLSSIYCIKESSVEIGGDSIDRYEVVDGQQRLTTLLLLFRILFNKLKDRQDSSQDIINSLKRIIFKERIDEGVKIPSLESNHQGRTECFKAFLLEGKRTAREDIEQGLISDKNLDRAITSIESFLQDKVVNTQSLFVQKVLKNLEIEFIELKKEQNVYKIFQSLNSRGLPIDSLDKVKSLVFLRVAKLTNDQQKREINFNALNLRWKSIYESIAKYNFNADELVRFSSNLHFYISDSKVPSIHDCLKKVEELDSQQAILDFLDLMIQVADTLSTIKQNWRLRPVTKILQSRFLAVCILIIYNNQSSNLSLTEGEKNSLLKQWEITSFRVYGLGRNDARYLISRFVTPGISLFKRARGESTQYNSRQCFQDIISISENAPYDLESLKKRFLADDCYVGWGTELVYFFNKVNEYNDNLDQNTKSESVKSDTIEMFEEISVDDDSNWENSNLSIEHIMPVSAPTNLDWKNQFEDENPEVNNPSLILNRIGNLLIVPREVNSGASDEPYPVKVRDYYSRPENDFVRQTVVYQSIRKSAESANGVGNDVWNCKSIINRTEYFAEFISKIWKDVAWETE